ncbi:MAG TPA: hypothetical protein VH234_03775 [Candidatus Saccharimonadales bacterium]|jgi:hypothetical protein|nr:hypothetical protein [Candidatus Saccharimonadales bacterium]
MFTIVNAIEGNMANSKDVAAEDLSIQNTLSMTVEERIDLLSNLIVDKIAEDRQNGEPLYKKIMGFRNG